MVPFTVPESRLGLFLVIIKMYTTISSQDTFRLSCLVSVQIFFPLGVSTPVSVFFEK